MIFNAVFVRQRRLDEEPALNKAKESISHLIAELRDFKKEQAAVTADLEQLKFKKTELGDKIVRLSSSVQQLILSFTFPPESKHFPADQHQTRMQQD